MHELAPTTARCRGCKAGRQAACFAAPVSCCVQSGPPSCRHLLLRASAQSATAQPGGRGLPVQGPSPTWGRGMSCVQCSICHDGSAGGWSIVLACGHVFHTLCLQLALTFKPKCPACRVGSQNLPARAAAGRCPGARPCVRCRNTCPWQSSSLGTVRSSWTWSQLPWPARSPWQAMQQRRTGHPPRRRAASHALRHGPPAGARLHTAPA